MFKSMKIGARVMGTALFMASVILVVAIVGALEASGSGRMLMFSIGGVGVVLGAVMAFTLSRSVTGAIADLSEETKNLVAAAVEGKLASRGNPDKVSFEFKEVIEGVNKTLDAVIAPLNVSAEYVDRISKGDIPPRITEEYRGDFNEIKNNLNLCIDSLKNGKLDTRGNSSRFAGDWGTLIKGLNELIDAFVGPINVTAEYVDRISKGDIPPHIVDDYKGDFNEIKNNLNATIDVMNNLLAETDRIIVAAAAGELDKRANDKLFAGGWQKLVAGVNDTITNIVNPLMVTADYIEKVAKGMSPPRITTEYKGQYN